jgi:hypothetical protein
MRKQSFRGHLLLPLALCLGLAACNNEKAEVKGVTTTKEKVELPLPVAYSGESEIGSRENMIAVMNWNKWLAANQLDSAFSLVADSLDVNLADGEAFIVSRDSAKAILRQYMGSMQKFELNYGAIIPLTVKTADGKKDEWVLSWTDEAATMKDGSSQHNLIHEDYLLVNGKIRQINQYARKLPAGK